MGYISGFDYDIFISYAHVDNLLASGEEKGWIERFYVDLQVYLSKRIGRTDVIKIWRDERRLDGNLLFDEVIKQSINKSAIFLALTSVGYYESTYCLQELEWFCKKAKKESIGLNVQNRPRIVKILLNNVIKDKWPDTYGRVTGFDFHDAQNAEEFGEPSIPASQLYKSQLRVLADALIKLIRSIAEPIAIESEEIGKVDAGHYDVYIAEVADSLRSIKKRLKSKLTQQGITVSSSIPPPHDAQDHEQAAKEAMKRSRLSVHMLDELGGAEIVGEENMTYPRKQANLGFQAARSQLIWVPRLVSIEKIEDESQKEFLNEIESHVIEGRGYDFLRGTADEIYRVIMDKLDELKNIEDVKSIPTSALLDIHEKDEHLVLDITRSLVAKNIIPLINPNADTPAENISILKDRLKRVHAVIIIYGKVNAQWVISRFEETVKIATIEKIPVRSFCIYLAPPKKEEQNMELAYPFLHPHLLDNQQCFNPTTLQPLYDDLGIQKHVS